MARPAGIKETKPRNTIFRKLAALPLAMQPTPLDVLLGAMDRAWSAAKSLEEENGSEERIIALLELAATAAARAAPYIHPRLTAIAYQKSEPPSRFDTSGLSIEQRTHLLTLLRQVTVPQGRGSPHGDGPIIEGQAMS